MHDLTQSGRENFAACIAMIILTAAMVILRFVVKFFHRQTPNGADWICLVSTCFFYAYCGVIVNFILNTSLYGSFDINPTHGPVELRNLLKVTYIAEILFGSIITSAKLSILWFYHNVFATANSKFNKRIIRGTAAVCLIWFITVTLVLIFQCSPIHAYWDMAAFSPRCINSPRLLLGYELTNLFLDVFILCIPVPMVWKLHLQLSNKMGILGIFLLGAFVCIASIVRISTIWNPPDIVQNFEYTAAMLWSTIQLGIAITCACLPALGPLLPAISKPILYIRSWGASIWSRSNAQSEHHGHKVSEEYQLQPPHSSIVGNTPQSQSSSQSWARSNTGQGRSDYDIERMPSRSILVDREIQVA